MYDSGYPPQSEAFGQQHNYQMVLRLIRQIMGWESFDELMIDYLIGQTKDPGAEQILYDMRQDERNHYDTLAKIYTDISGQRSNVQTPSGSIPESYEAGLGEVLQRKGKMMKLYVHLYIHSPLQYQSILYPFLAEEQTHMQMINYLLIRKCCL
ncbi:ferritin-like domain-containing protein [Bacillus sp. H-16]|uniref:ferritin-like domain-containing protein n=1 Tax=Alteribacter salitolerans TaxID=2912333 RepID=UPI001966CDD5|nr:ferritin-like domain-containing protein [Alteribacter salitolerans]MBM7095313.1 ferritin-like domain-containing protein [Alteribacter salitolerans]